MKLSELKKVIAQAEEFMQEHDIKTDPRCLVDVDENGYYELESLEADTLDDGELVINFKSSNES